VCVVLYPIIAMASGLAILVWSADRFVDGAASMARHFGMPSLLIGMVIVGFGTSAPEMVISALSSYQGNPGIALGNAYGSNITNIALILGITAMIQPITVESLILKKELPILTAVTFLAGYIVHDGEITRMDAAVLMGVFLVLLAWAVYQGLSRKQDALGTETEMELSEHPLPLRMSVLWLVTGLVFMIASSRLLVWGAVEIAESIGVSDLVIGLTIVAVGTSLPELASSIIATRKGEHDLALGNVLGSNLFNTLTVVGIAGLIRPIAVAPEVFKRDITAMSILTVSLFFFGYGFRGQGRINRFKGAALFGAYVVYSVYLVSGVVRG
jgi:cation:H+ antiporter